MDSGYIEVHQARLYYERAGEGPPLVVLPGGPGWGAGYLRDELTTLLSDRLHLFFHDQRGTGHSTGTEHAERLNVSTFVADLDAVREFLSLDRLHLLGHSFGGLLAMHYAAARPARAGSLVLVDPDPASAAYWRAFREIVARRRPAGDRREMAAIEATTGWSVDPALSERHTAVHLRAYFGRRDAASQLRLRLDRTVLKNASVTGAAVRRDLGDYDIHEALGRIRCPVLIITGTESVFPAEAMDALHKRIGNAHLVRLSGVGHFPYMEAARDFRREVLHFHGAL